MEDVSSLVGRQYDAFAYPEPFADLATEIERGYYQLGDPSLYGPILWPGGRPAGPLKILVAGCGTVQAAYAAYQNPADEVVGLDLSRTSLKHERYLQDRHGLENLRLFQGDLLDVGTLGSSFDVILCTGVLHHLADPARGLVALRKVLAPGGVMVLMLYGQTIRTGVYMLQDVFRRTGMEQSAEGIAQVRAILREIGPDHPVQAYVRSAVELKFDAALVDTFLHPQDRAYTVPKLLELIEDCGLVFQNWVENHPYWRNSFWGPNTAIAAAVDPLPPREHWAAIEMLAQSTGLHALTVRHLGEPVRVVDFENGDWPRFIPYQAPGLARRGPGFFVRASYEFRCSELEQFVLDGVDGTRAIEEIIEVPALSELPDDERRQFARSYFEHLWKLGHVMIALP